MAAPRYINKTRRRSVSYPGHNIVLIPASQRVPRESNFRCTSRYPTHIRSSYDTGPPLPSVAHLLSLVVRLPNPICHCTDVRAAVVENESSSHFQTEWRIQLRCGVNHKKKTGPDEAFSLSLILKIASRATLIKSKSHILFDSIRRCMARLLILKHTQSCFSLSSTLCVGQRSTSCKSTELSWSAASYPNAFTVDLHRFLADRTYTPFSPSALSAIQIWFTDIALTHTAWAGHEWIKGVLYCGIRGKVSDAVPYIYIFFSGLTRLNPFMYSTYTSTLFI